MSLVSTFAMVSADSFCCYYSKRRTNLSPDLSPEKLQSTLPASAEDSACLPFGHMSTQFCTSVKILGGGWSLTLSGNYCPNTSASGEKKMNFLLSAKRELGDKPSEMKSVHRGRLNALGDGITA